MEFPYPELKPDKASFPVIFSADELSGWTPSPKIRNAFGHLGSMVRHSQGSVSDWIPTGFPS